MMSHTDPGTESVNDDTRHQPYFGSKAGLKDSVFSQFYSELWFQNKDSTSSSSATTGPDQQSSSRSSSKFRNQEQEDETCFLLLKQSKEGRQAQLKPKVEMICISKNNPHEVREYIRTTDFKIAMNHIQGILYNPFYNN